MRLFFACSINQNKIMYVLLQLYNIIEHPQLSSNSETWFMRFVRAYPDKY